MSWGPAPLWAGPVSVGKGRPGDVGDGEKGKRLAGGVEEKLGSLDSSRVPAAGGSLSFSVDTGHTPGVSQTTRSAPVLC